MIEWCIAIAVIIISAVKVSKFYEESADMAREKYFNEHLVEFKKYNISEARARKFLADDKDEDLSLPGTFLVSALIVGIVIGIIFSGCLGDEEKTRRYEFWKDIAIISWGFWSAIFAVSAVTSDVDNKIKKHLEKYRCPYCSAPLSFWETKSYKSGEYHYQKKVKKYDSKLQMDVVKTENRVKYDEHHIYTCNYCKKTKDVVYPVDKCVDGFGV